MNKFLAELTKADFDLPQGDLTQGSVDTIFQFVFALVGIIAVIILMLASLKYVTSRGEPAAVAKAKNTIVYAVIGIVVAASAFTIISFVVKKV